MPRQPATAQDIDHSITEHNHHVESMPDMIAYRERQRQGSLSAAYGAPRMLFKQVQQTRYMSTGNREFCQHPPILFRVAGPGFPGIKLVNAYEKKAHVLVDGTERITLSKKSQKINVRLMVHGQRPFKKSMHARRASISGQPQERRAIAHLVAKAIKIAISQSGGVWRLPGVCCTFEDLYLLELQHVSKGSWQPVLAFHNGAAR